MQSTPGHTRSVAAFGTLVVVLATAATAAAATARPSHAALSTTPHHAVSTRSRPATPTNLVAASGGRGLSLTWASSSTTGFEIEQASDPTMSQGLRTYTVHGNGHEFTPYGLTKDQTYYSQVRALNGSAHSGWSNQVTAAPSTLEQPLRVMTYNILEARRDGQHEGNRVIAPWSKRKPKAAELIKQAHPDVIAIEEASDFVGNSGHTRQVSSLRSAVGAPYALANTEIAPPKPHYFRTGVYILYNKSTYKPVGAGGHFSIGDPNWGVYQTFRNRTSGAKFVFIATHLYIGFGQAADEKRYAETTSLIRQGRAYANKVGLPLVYAGDFNSATDLHFTFDAASRAMLAANMADAFLVAQSHANGDYNSANQLYRHPKKTGDRIDHIFAPPGIAVRLAGIVLHLKHGHFVGTIPSDHNPMIADVLYPY